MKGPERRRGPVAGIFLLGLVAGCAPLAPADAPQRTDPALLDQVARVLAGEYSNHAQWQRTGSSDRGPVDLVVALEPMGDPARVVLRLSQRRSGQEPRQFLLALGPDQQPDRLAGEFAPVGDDGQVRRSCPMVFSVRRTGFVGETDPETCQFGEAGDRTGLLKEIAHDGRQLVIADRMVSLVSGSPVGEDRIVQFDRVRRFSGWAGVRDSDGGWRLSENVGLRSDGTGIEPVDAAGMDLGVRLELAPYIWRDDGPAILRLSATDLASGQMLGQAWADFNAEQIGLALPDLQVGLSLER